MCIWLLFFFSFHTFLPLDSHEIVTRFLLFLWCLTAFFPPCYSSLLLVSFLPPPYFLLHHFSDLMWYDDPSPFSCFVFSMLTMMVSLLHFSLISATVTVPMFTTALRPAHSLGHPLLMLGYSPPWERTRSPTSPLVERWEAELDSAFIGPLGLGCPMTPTFHCTLEMGW